MDNIKTDAYYKEKVVENIDAILEYMGDKSYDEFVEDDLLIDAIMFRLVQMAENIGHLSFEFKESRPDIQWGMIAGFRNRIVHDYGKTDYSLVYEILSSDLRVLKEACED